MLAPGQFTRMKKLPLLLFLLLGVARLGAQSQTVDLGSHGKITCYLDDSWQFTTADLGGRIVNITPKGDVNATCTLTITFPDQDHYDTKSRLRLRVEVNGTPMAEQSVEGKAVAKPFELKSGYGFYCNFTDPELVGKPPQKGNYKTMTIGLIHLAPDVLIEVSISADGFTTEAYQQLLGMLEGMEFEAPSGGHAI